MKKPLGFIVTDLHLTGENSKEIKDLMNQAFIEAENLGFDHIYVAGDIFDSRKAQSLKTLNAWMEILDSAESRGMLIIAIPGNHDKPSYKAERSYLDIYQLHPSMELVRDYFAYEAGEYMVHMIPFFDEKEVYPEYLARATSAVKLMPDNKHILITHIAVDGVRNNDGSKIEETLSTNSFNCFERVYVGHYHDYQEVKNIVYIGAVKQKDFGENNKKGFTVFYDDGSWDQIKSDFVEYEVVKIDLNTVTESELNKITKVHANSKDNIRFKFCGTEEKIKSIDKSRFEDLGIGVKCEHDDPEVIVDYVELKEFEGFDNNSIKAEWDEFVEKNGIGEVIKKNGKLLLENTLK